MGWTDALQMFGPRRRSEPSIMRSFEQFFSAESIIRELCRARVSLAKKRNDRLFLHRISKDFPHAEDTKLPIGMSDVLGIFPPRRHWHSFRPRCRRQTPAANLNLGALFNAVICLRNETPNAPWVAKLEKRLEAIRKRVLSRAKFRFGTPRIHAAEKSAKERTYRPIAEFSLDDKIVDSLTARYLRRQLDAALSPSCLAFRCSQRNQPPPTIHDALDKILQANSRHQVTGQSVAECDIKGFFDCVSHGIARGAVRQLITDARKRYPTLSIDRRAMRIFNAYLNAYSFSVNVAKTAQASLQKRKPGAKFKWPKDDLVHLHGKAELPNIGVPQGGALSCLIANAVLHRADKELNRLEGQLGKGSFVYLRYCDDMILLAQDRKVCKKTYSRYCRSVKRLRLPIHPPKDVGKYSKEFWDGKSNKPYRWAKPNDGEGIPWIQFVGYQVRYDGTMRVRLKSLKKHFRKLTEASDGLLAALNPGPKKLGAVPPFAPGLRKNALQVRHRFHQKLISIAVGRRRLHQALDETMGMCWANGFRGLLGKKIISSSLKALDRHRERQIQRVIRRLKPLPPSKSSEHQKSEARHVLGFYGFPFSYWAQFQTFKHQS
jgi:hypothetical protein